MKKKKKLSSGEEFEKEIGLEEVNDEVVEKGSKKPESRRWNGTWRGVERCDYSLYRKSIKEKFFDEEKLRKEMMEYLFNDISERMQATNYVMNFDTAYFLVKNFLSRRAIRQNFYDLKRYFGSGVSGLIELCKDFVGGVLELFQFGKLLILAPVILPERFREWNRIRHMEKKIMKALQEGELSVGEVKTVWRRYMTEYLNYLGRILKEGTYFPESVLIKVRAIRYVMSFPDEFFVRDTSNFWEEFKKHVEELERLDRAGVVIPGLTDDDKVMLERILKEREMKEVQGKDLARF